MRAHGGRVQAGGEAELRGVSVRPAMVGVACSYWNGTWDSDIWASFLLFRKKDESRWAYAIRGQASDYSQAKAITHTLKAKRTGRF